MPERYTGTPSARTAAASRSASGRARERLRAHEQHGPLGLREEPRRPKDLRRVGRGRGDRRRRPGRRARLPPPKSRARCRSTYQEPRAIGEAARRLPGLGPVPLAHERLGVEKIHRALDEHGPRHALAADPERRLERGGQVAHPRDARGALDVRPDERQLVDVLERAAPAQQRRRGPAQQHERRLRQLGVLEGGDRVGDAGAGGDRGDAGHARQARDRVGREHGRGLVARVDDADAAGLRGHQDRRDVPAAEREQEANPVPHEDVGHEIPAGHGGAILSPDGALCRRRDRPHGNDRRERSVSCMKPDLREVRDDAIIVGDDGFVPPGGRARDAGRGRRWRRRRPKPRRWSGPTWPPA